MKQLIKSVENLPLIIKLILAIPGLDIFWNVFRVVRSLAKENILGAVLAVALIIIGIPFMWLVDLICLFASGSIWWID